MLKTLKWGIIGTGKIAARFAEGLSLSKTGKLAAVGSRAKKTARAFAKKFHCEAHGSYEELLADENVEAVYISTPHPYHAEWAIKAAKAKKHILCEKPIGMNHAEALAIVKAARKNKVFLMEAFMYRCHPQTKKLIELLKKKVIGEVRVIQTAFSYNAGFLPKTRIFNNALGGGGILDVGCYCVSMCRLVAGIANGKEFAEPLEFKAFGHFAKTGVDGWTAGIMKFPGDIIAQVSTGVQVDQQNSLHIYGSKGSIEIKSPWFSYGKFLLKKGSKVTEISYNNNGDVYALEADIVAKNLKNLFAKEMSPADSLGNMKACDMWRAAFGFKYKSEKRYGKKL